MQPTSKPTIPLGRSSAALHKPTSQLMMSAALSLLGAAALMLVMPVL
jgi:hypothetical protein